MSNSLGESLVSSVKSFCQLAVRLVLQDMYYHLVYFTYYLLTIACVGLALSPGFFGKINPLLNSETQEVCPIVHVLSTYIFIIQCNYYEVRH